MGSTVGIIGLGRVGTSAAISTLHAGIADTLLLNDLHDELAEGEALDLAHGAAFYPRCTVKPASVADMRGADAVVLAAGRGGRPGESRLALLQDNARLAAEVGRTLAGFAGTILVVSNPVDVMTRIATEASGLPAGRVIGTGTVLDAARLRQRLGEHLGVATQSVHAQVIGEHGDSEVVLWSGARVGGVPVRQWPGWTAGDEADISRSVREAAGEVIRRKGATNHAIGLVAAHVLRSVLRDERRVLTVSHVQPAASPFPGVALSVPAVVGRQGAEPLTAPAMDPEEAAALARSAEVLQAAWASVGQPSEPKAPE